MAWGTVRRRSSWSARIDVMLLHCIRAHVGHGGTGPRMRSQTPWSGYVVCALDIKAKRGTAGPRANRWPPTLI